MDGRRNEEPSELAGGEGRRGERSEEVRGSGFGVDRFAIRRICLGGAEECDDGSGNSKEYEQSEVQRSAGVRVLCD